MLGNFQVHPAFAWEFLGRLQRDVGFLFLSAFGAKTQAFGCSKRALPETVAVESRPENTEAELPLLKLILDALPLAVFVIARDFTIRTTNAPGRNFLGESEKTLEPRRCYELLYGRHSICPFCPANDADDMENLSSRIIEKDIQARRPGQAMESNYRLRFAPAPSAPSEILLLETLEDTTASKEEQEQILLQENLAALGIMVSGVAHELNNPLTGIGLTLQNLISNLPSIEKSDIKKRLLIIKKDLTRAARIVSDILSFANPGKLRISHSNLLLVVQKAKHNIQRLYPILARAIRWEISGDEVYADIDVEKIERLFSNLFRNSVQAFDYAPGYIRIELRRAGRFAHIIIEDNAGGIPKEILPHIFRPFYTKMGQSGKGTGLGLSICHSIVKDHKGNIHVRSFGDKTRFYISIPLEQGEHER